MKWQNFVNVTSVNPWVRNHVGSLELQSLLLGLSSEAKQQFREYVQKNLEYIAFRPFNSFNGNMGSYEEFRHVVDEANRSEKYWVGENRNVSIRYHIEGFEQPFARLRHINKSFYNEIVQILDLPNSEHWAKQGGKIIIDAVVMVNTMHNVWRGNKRRPLNQCVDVYLCPPNYDMTESGEWNRIKE